MKINMYIIGLIASVGISALVGRYCMPYIRDSQTLISIESENEFVIIDAPCLKKISSLNMEILLEMGCDMDSKCHISRSNVLSGNMKTRCDQMEHGWKELDTCKVDDTKWIKNLYLDVNKVYTFKNENVQGFVLNRPNSAVHALIYNYNDSGAWLMFENVSQIEDVRAILENTKFQLNPVSHNWW